MDIITKGGNTDTKVRLSMTASNKEEQNMCSHGSGHSDAK